MVCWHGQLGRKPAPFWGFVWNNTKFAQNCSTDTPTNRLASLQPLSLHPTHLQFSPCLVTLSSPSPFLGYLPRQLSPLPFSSPQVWDNTEGAYVQSVGLTTTIVVPSQRTSLLSNLQLTREDRACNDRWMPNALIYSWHQICLQVSLDTRSAGTCDVPRLWLEQTTSFTKFSCFTPWPWPAKRGNFEKLVGKRCRPLTCVRHLCLHSRAQKKSFFVWTQAATQSSPSSPRRRTVKIYRHWRDKGKPTVSQWLNTRLNLLASLPFCLLISKAGNARETIKHCITGNSRSIDFSSFFFIIFRFLQTCMCYLVYTFRFQPPLPSFTVDFQKRIK